MRPKLTLVERKLRPAGAKTAEIQIWESEGGALLSPPESAGTPLSGTQAQVEWAARIRKLVDADFERVASSFRSAAAKQSPGKQAETAAILAILEDKRHEVMGRTRADYFIHDWQEIGDQVRRLIFEDPRFQAIKSKRTHGH